MSETNPKKAITITDELEVGPLLAVILMIYFFSTGQLQIQWQWLLILFLLNLRGSVIINWRKLKSHFIDKKQ